MEATVVTTDDSAKGCGGRASARMENAFGLPDFAANDCGRTARDTASHFVRAAAGNKWFAHDCDQFRRNSSWRHEQV